MQILTLGSLDLLTAFPWMDAKEKNHSYPSVEAVDLTNRAAMLEDIPQLLMSSAYLVLTDQTQIVPVISVCLTVVQLMWTCLLYTSPSPRDRG